jgi:hypothetical protein
MRQMACVTVTFGVCPAAAANNHFIGFSPSALSSAYDCVDVFSAENGATLACRKRQPSITHDPTVPGTPTRPFGARQ